MYTGDVTSLQSKVNFYAKNKMEVDLIMSNWHVIDKFLGNARCCHFLLNCIPPIVCPPFFVNGNGLLPAVWKFQAKLMSTTPVLVFDGIDHSIAAFERNLIPPGEGGFFQYLVGDSVLRYFKRINFFRCLRFTQEVSPSLHRNHISQPIIVLWKFWTEGVSMYASVVIIAWPLV